jgi:hypothetical protein
MLFYNVPSLSSPQIKFFVIMYTDSNITEAQNFHMLFSYYGAGVAQSV